MESNPKPDKGKEKLGKHQVRKIPRTTAEKRVLLCGHQANVPVLILPAPSIRKIHEYLLT